MNEWFDRFAAAVSNHVARAWFFAACVALIIGWLPTTVLLPFNVSQLLINTATTIVTFLLVALLQNTQDRATRALHHKLDAILRGIADVLDQTDGVDKSGVLAREMREIAGVEMESSQ